MRNITTLWKEFTKDKSLKPLVGLLVSGLCFVVFTRFDFSRTFQVMALLAGTISYKKIIEKINYEPDQWVERVVVRTVSYILYVEFFAFLAISFGEVELAIGAILGIQWLGLLIIAIVNGIKLFNEEESLPRALVQYLILSSMTIFLFASAFSISNIVPNQGIVWNLIDQEVVVSGAEDLLYFSASAYYSSLLGDILPKGASKAILILENVISLIIHVFIAGVVISNISSRKKKVTEEKLV